MSGDRTDALFVFPKLFDVAGAKMLHDVATRHKEMVNNLLVLLCNTNLGS